MHANELLGAFCSVSIFAAPALFGAIVEMPSDQLGAQRALSSMSQSFREPGGFCYDLARLINFDALINCHDKCCLDRQV
jgi:hypothetical protein